MNRRTFLTRVGHVAGAGAVYGAMGAIGLLNRSAAANDRGDLGLSGNAGGRTVLILGAGVAGLCVAHELGKLGYRCTVLEASTRPGGRAHTIRGGDTDIDTDGVSQTCHFDPGHYFNAGPARIPQEHITLDYCREFGVAIEPFGNLNEAAYLHRDSAGALAGQRLRYREVRSDANGYVAELLSKAVTSGSLDEELSIDDRANLIQYLVTEGGLTEENLYKGSDRRGYSVWPGAAYQAGQVTPPQRFSELFASGLGEHFAFNWSVTQQMMMFQMVGGNDRLAYAMADRLGPTITYQARVDCIEQGYDSSGAKQVTVNWTDRFNQPQTSTAEFCVCTIPLSVLSKLDLACASEHKAAIQAASTYASTAKVALQFKRRFWEEDDRIFAGISRTDMPITQILYPSNGFLSKKGVLIGCYTYGPSAATFNAMTPEQRIAAALEQGVKIHPQYPAEFENGMTISWKKMPFAQGGWAGWSPETRGTHYKTLCEPDGTLHFAGEHLSYLGAWMAGAFESGRRACRMIHEQAMRTRATA